MKRILTITAASAWRGRRRCWRRSRPGRHWPTPRATWSPCPPGPRPRCTLKPTHGCGESPTVQVRIRAPFPDAVADDVEGWTATATPDGAGNTVLEWTGGVLPADEDGAFPVEFVAPDAPGHAAHVPGHPGVRRRGRTGVDQRGPGRRVPGAPRARAGRRLAGGGHDRRRPARRAGPRPARRHRRRRQPAGVTSRRRRPRRRPRPPPPPPRRRRPWRRRRRRRRTPPATTGSAPTTSVAATATTDDDAVGDRRRRWTRTTGAAATPWPR